MNRSLIGIRILTTRDTAQKDDLKEKLEGYGAEVICIPTIRIVDPPDWRPFDSAAARMNQFDWLIFTSVNAVTKTADRLRNRLIEPAAFHHLNIAVVGDQTAKAVEKAGWRVDLIPTRYQGEGLLDAMEKQDLRGQQVWFPRALKARNLLIEGLEKAGAKVTMTPVYQNTMPIENRTCLQKALRESALDWITFTSSSTAANFVTLAGDAVLNPGLPKLASIGEITTRTLNRFSLYPFITADPQNLEGLCRGIVEWHRQQAGGQ